MLKGVICMKLTMKQARMASEKTQRQCADLFGICEDTYRKIENDPTRITIVQAKAFSDFVGFPIDTIIFTPDSSLNRVAS